MKLARIDDAIEKCQAHLDSAGPGSPIEPFLVQYLLILISATFEEEIERLLEARVSRAADLAIQEFGKSCVHQMLRSIKISELSGLLGRFGPACKQVFQSRVKGTRAETFYGTLIANRDVVAHSAGLQVTFVELVKNYDEAHLVLDAIDEALASC